MDVDKAEDIIYSALNDLYLHYSFLGCIEKYNKAVEALDYLSKVAGSKTDNIFDRVAGNKDIYIKEIKHKPKYYVEKIPYCNDCGIELERVNFNLLSNPPKLGYKCNKCGKEYYIDEREVGEYWEWQN